MAKKFWEREEFDIELFTAVFYGVYNVYYESGNNGPMQRNTMLEGERLLQDKAVAPLLRAFAEHRQDIITSDREVTAFAVTYGIYLKRYGA